MQRWYCLTRSEKASRTAPLRSVLPRENWRGRIACYGVPTVCQARAGVPPAASLLCAAGRQRRYYCYLFSRRGTGIKRYSPASLSPGVPSPRCSPGPLGLPPRMTAPPFKRTVQRGPDSLGTSHLCGDLTQDCGTRCVHLRARSAQVLTCDGISPDWANETLPSL